MTVALIAQGIRTGRVTRIVLVLAACLTVVAGFAASGSDGFADRKLWDGVSPALRSP